MFREQKTECVKRFEHSNFVLVIFKKDTGLINLKERPFTLLNRIALTENMKNARGKIDQKLKRPTHGGHFSTILVSRIL